MSDGVAAKESGSGVLTTLLKGLEMLEAVAENPSGATAKNLASTLNIKLGACYHILRTLRSQEYLVKGAHGVFRAGPRSIDLSSRLSAFIGPSPEIAAILTRLNNRTRETSYVCGWHHGTIRIQQQVAGVHALTVELLGAGYAGNMHARASCLAILAHIPIDRIATIFRGLELEQLTPSTIANYDDLVAELGATRKRGYALDLEAFQIGICCVSAPYFDASGNPVGSFTVSVPTSRFDTTKAALIEAVREAGDLATEVLAAPDRTSGAPSHRAAVIS